MSELMSGEALSGGGLVLAAWIGTAIIKWLAAGKARQLDGMPSSLHALELDMVKLSGRMAMAEKEIANDKAGRAAVSAMQTDIAVIRSAVSAMQTEQRDMWSQINKTKAGV